MLADKAGLRKLNKGYKKKGNLGGIKASGRTNEEIAVSIADIFGVGSANIGKELTDEEKANIIREKYNGSK